MTVETKTYIVRAALWVASIIVVAWPLHLARPVIGDIAYVVVSAIVLGGCYLIGRALTKNTGKTRQESRP